MSPTRWTGPTPEVFILASKSGEFRCAKFAVLPPKELQTEGNGARLRGVGTIYCPAGAAKIKKKQSSFLPWFCAPTKGLVHRLISGRHTVGFKRVWMLDASEERIRCDT